MVCLKTGICKHGIPYFRIERNSTHSIPNMDFCFADFTSHSFLFEFPALRQDDESGKAGREEEFWFLSVSRCATPHELLFFPFCLRVALLVPSARPSFIRRHRNIYINDPIKGKERLSIPSTLLFLSPIPQLPPGLAF